MEDRILVKNNDKGSPEIENLQGGVSQSKEGVFKK
jgi:hypothetical protein